MKDLLVTLKWRVPVRSVRLVFLTLFLLFVGVLVFVPMTSAYAQGGELPPFEEYYQFLVAFTVAGLGIVKAVNLFVQQLKAWLNLEGAVVMWIAIGIAFVLGTLVLYYLSPWGYPETFLDYFGRAVAAFLFAWFAPWAYTYNKQVAQAGMKKHIEEIEEQAVLGSSAKG